MPLEDGPTPDGEPWQPDDELLVRFLLGALPEVETERLDELSITDDQLARRLRTIEQNLVDAYAKGELLGEILARFRSSYLASPTSSVHLRPVRSR